jgi:hypothetical protein
VRGGATTGTHTSWKAYGTYKRKGKKKCKNPNIELAAQLEETEIIRMAQLHHHESPPQHFLRDYGSSDGKQCHGNEQEHNKY